MNLSVSKTGLYDLAKCITTILVVVAHATRMYTPFGAIPVSNQSAFLNYFTDYVYIFHMPLFVMLSGCIFGCCIESGKYSDTLAFIRNKGKRLLIPYIAFGILYVAPVMRMLGMTTKKFGEYVINDIVLAYDSRHLWYLLTLFWIFLIYIFLRPLLLMPPKGFILTGAISLAIFVAGRFSPNVFQLSSAFSYQLFFFLGVVFNYFYSNIDQLFKKYRRIGWCLPVVLLLMFAFNPNLLTEYVYKGIGIAMIFLICWVLLCRFPDLLKHPLISIIKRNSFGIYLFHPMIIYIMFYLFGKMDISPFLLSSLVSVSSIVISVYATKLIRILHLAPLIGE